MAKLTGNSYGFTGLWVAKYNPDTDEYTVVKRLKLPATVVIRLWPENWRYLPIIWQRNN